MMRQLLLTLCLAYPCLADTVVLDGNRSVLSYSDGVLTADAPNIVESVPSSGGISATDPVYDAASRCRWTVVNPGDAPTKRVTPRWPSGAAYKRAAMKRLLDEWFEKRNMKRSLEDWQAANSAILDMSAELAAVNTRLTQIETVLSGQ